MNTAFNVYTIDSFSLENEVKTGNPAGFVVGDMPSEADMRAIAAAVGFSETAFVKPLQSSDADFEVRFFTPNEEVDLCGHATIGLFSGLFQLGHIQPGSYKQLTKAGLLQVNIAADGQVLMEQAQPQFGHKTESSLIAASLGLAPEDIRTDLPCQAISTGLLDLLIPVKDVETLERIQADDEAISRLSSELGVVGYHVFAMTGEETARCRNFAPLYAIPEEAATGTSNGALAAYLNRYRPQLVEGIALKAVAVPKKYTFTQGVEMGQPSQINALVDETGTIWVGGYACHLGEKKVIL